MELLDRPAVFGNEISIPGGISVANPTGTVKTPHMQSVIVTTYNKVPHLKLVLEGLLHQRDAEFEVIIADDGSGAETRELIDAYRQKAPFRIEHIWQKDEGFRAARVRNLGVQAASGHQIVFLDGDCIPFPEFLAAHHQALQPRIVLAGDRLFLSETLSAQLTVEDVASGNFMARVPADEFKQLRRRIFKDKIYRFTRLKDRPKVVTANVSMSRQALEEVNGLDERFVGWGHEDEDLRRRLKRRGYRIEAVTHTAFVCHLWHKQVESFKGKVKFGDNVPYFKRGFFLSCCREGLRARPMEDCKIAFNSVLHENNALSSRDLPLVTIPSKSKQGAAVEVSIAYGPQARHVAAEVRIAVGPTSLKNKDSDVIVNFADKSAAGGVDLQLTAGHRGEAAIITLEQELQLDLVHDRVRLFEALSSIL